MKIAGMDVPTQADRLKAFRAAVATEKVLDGLIRALRDNTSLQPEHLFPSTYTFVLPHVYLDALEAGYLKLLFWQINSRFSSRSIACASGAFLLLNLPTGAAYPKQDVRLSVRSTNRQPIPEGLALATGGATHWPGAPVIALPGCPLVQPREPAMEP